MEELSTAVYSSSEESTRSCAVIIPLPLLTPSPKTEHSASWHKCLIPAYQGGFNYFYHHDALVAIGKIAEIDKSEDLVSITHYWILYQASPQEPWMRGELQQGLLLLDGRWSGPHLTSGRPQARLGDWTIRFMTNLGDDWQYAQVCQVIDQANQHLPAGLAINQDWEHCQVPQKLLHQKLKAPAVPR